VVGCIVIGIYFRNLYGRIWAKSTTLLVQQICLVIGLAFLIQALLAYIGRADWSLPRWDMIFGSLLVLIVVPAWQVFYSRVIIRAIGSQSVLFLGAAPVSQEITAHLTTRPEIGMTVLGYVEDGEVRADLPGGRVLGRVSDPGKSLKLSNRT